MPCNSATTAGEYFNVMDISVVTITAMEGVQFYDLSLFTFAKITSNISF